MQHLLYGDGKTNAMNARQQLMQTSTYASAVSINAAHATGATSNTIGINQMPTTPIAATAEHMYKLTPANGAANVGKSYTNLTTGKTQGCVLTAEAKF